MNKSIKIFLIITNINLTFILIELFFLSSSFPFSDMNFAAKTIAERIKYFCEIEQIFDWNNLTKWEINSGLNAKINFKI